MQEPLLFNDTIKNNILFGKLDATNEEVWQAAQQANAISFIESDLDNLEGEKAKEKLEEELRKVNIIELQTLIKNICK